MSGIVSTYSPSQTAAFAQACQAVAPDPNTLAAAGCYVSRNGKSVMVPPVAGTFGTMGRGIFRDTGFYNVDFSVFKNFNFKERYNATFRVEFFNLFNHPDLANPYSFSTGNDPSASPAVRLRMCHTGHCGRQRDCRFGERPRDTTRIQAHVLSSSGSVGSRP